MNGLLIILLIIEMILILNKTLIYSKIFFPFSKKLLIIHVHHQLLIYSWKHFAQLMVKSFQTFMIYYWIPFSIFLKKIKINLFISFLFVQMKKFFFQVFILHIFLNHIQSVFGYMLLMMINHIIFQFYHYSIQILFLEKI